MQKPRVIKRITIEYSEESKDSSGDLFGVRVHKKTVEEQYIKGVPNNPLITTRSEYIV